MPTTTNGTTDPTSGGDDDVPHDPFRSSARRAARRFAFATAAVIGASLALAGCASGSGDGATDITFHMSKPEAIPYMSDLVEEYNASQDDVNVVLDTSGIDAVSAGFVRGNPPDIGLNNYNHGDGALHPALRACRTSPTSGGRAERPRGPDARRISSASAPAARARFRTRSWARR